METNWSQFRAEMWALFQIGVPMTITQTLYGIVYPITVAFCGSLGTDEIDQASLAISIYQLFVVTAENALRWTTLAFIGQVKHTDQPHRVGIYVQRALLAAVCLWSVSLCVAINAANYLILIGQIPSIAIGAERFIWILQPGCLAVLVFRILMAYLDSLGRVYASTVVLAAFCAVCFTAEYLVIHCTTWGVLGVAACLSVCQCGLPVVLFVYIRVTGAHRTTWGTGGWSVRALVKWRQFYGFLVPILATNLVVYLSTELGSFIAGMLGKVELAAQSIMFQIYMLGSQLPFGIVSAGTVIITAHASQRQPRKAQLASAALLVQCVLIAVAFAAVIMVTPDTLPRLFSHDESVIDLYASLHGYLAVYAVGFISSWAFAPMLRALKKNSWLVWLALLNYFVLGHPLGISLTFATPLGLRGLWIGFTLAAVARVLNGGVAVGCLRWEAESRQIAAEMSVETDLEAFCRRGIEKQPLLEARKLKGDDEFDASNGGSRLAVRSSTVTRSSLGCRELMDKVIIAAVLSACVVASIVGRICIPPRNSTATAITNVTISSRR